MVYDSSSRRLVEGNLLENRSFSSDTNRYKFTNKERDNESTYDYFGARYYDSRIGRWGGVEPLMEKFVSFTPYCYSTLNPLAFKDPFGQGPKITVFGNEIEVIFDISYTTRDNDAVYGLDQGQVTALGQFEQNIESYWSGNFNIEGQDYLINVQVNLINEAKSYNAILAEKQRLMGGYIIAGNYEGDPNIQSELKSERGVGVIGSILYMLSGKNLRPYRSTGTHEAGHTMGLTHSDAREVSTHKFGSTSAKIMSIMGSVLEHKKEEYRDRPRSEDWKKILEMNAIDLKKNYSTYLNH